MTQTSIISSHMPLALGLSESEAFNCLRFSVGRFNTEADISQAVAAVRQVVVEQRELV